MKVKVVALPVETWDEILRRIEGSDEYAALDFALGKTEEEEYKLGTSMALEGPNVGGTDASRLNSVMIPAILPERNLTEAMEDVIKTIESQVEWTKVESSNLSAIAYREDLQLLLVEFKGGAVYKYAGVPKGVFESLMSADSKGRFFAANIKDHFPAERLEVKHEQD